MRIILTRSVQNSLGFDPLLKSVLLFLLVQGVHLYMEVFNLLFSERKGEIRMPFSPAVFQVPLA